MEVEVGDEAVDGVGCEGLPPVSWVADSTSCRRSGVPGVAVAAASAGEGEEEEEVVVVVVDEFGDEVVEEEEEEEEESPSSDVFTVDGIMRRGTASGPISAMRAGARRARRRWRSAKTADLRLRRRDSATRAVWTWSRRPDSTAVW